MIQNPKAIPMTPGHELSGDNFGSMFCMCMYYFVHAVGKHYILAEHLVS